MTDLDLKNKRVLIREDFNVPIKNGVISSDARVIAAIPTIKYALEAGAKIILMSHLGRPSEGNFEKKFSIKPIAEYLEKLLKTKIKVIADINEKIHSSDNEILFLENVRFNDGEKKNKQCLSKSYASMCDIFVMDAFGSAHRSQSSTHGVAKYAPIACGGPLLINELDILNKILKQPARPMIAIVGGSKISSKLAVLKTLANRVDQLIVGGGIANTFLAAKGFPVGSSLYEKNFIEEAKEIMLQTEILLPTDVIVGQKFCEFTSSKIKLVSEVSDDDMIFDFGPTSAKKLANNLALSGTILWNGPIGVFEFDKFESGTRTISKAIADSNAYSVAGGGDTLAAVEKFGIMDSVSYISTGGGAFLEYIGGEVLPAVEVLQSRFKEISSRRIETIID
jgi:phosphoglycerate kinase